MLTGFRWAAVTTLVALFALGGCEQEGPFERAGEEADEAAGAIGEEAERATEEAQEQAEQFGEQERQ